MGVIFIVGMADGTMGSVGVPHRPAASPKAILTVGHKLHVASVLAEFVPAMVVNL
jgi:hypothetical protein